MKSKKIILISLLCILIAVLSYFYFSKKQTKTISWKTTPVERGDIRINVTATGSINALTTVQVGSQVSGTIARLFADFNSIVKKGEIIAVLDTTFLSATKDDAEAVLNKATVHLNQMKQEFDRIKKLFEENVVAQSDYDLAASNYESSRSSLKSAQAQLNRARINLQYATIKAPISGVVISRNVDVGQTVVSSFNSPTLFTIANDLTKMQVHANVDEADIGQIKPGQKASFTVDAYPNKLFAGIIKQIRLQPNVIQNVVNYTVLIDVPNPDLKLLPGLTANININITEHFNILKAPTAALHFMPPADYIQTMKSLPDSIKNNLKSNQIGNSVTGHSTYLWVKKGETISPHKITIGLIEGGYAEISGDIKETDEIVTGVIKDKKDVPSKNPFIPTFPRQRRI